MMTFYNIPVFDKRCLHGTKRAGFRHTSGTVDLYIISKAKADSDYTSATNRVLFFSKSCFQLGSLYEYDIVTIFLLQFFV